MKNLLIIYNIIFLSFGNVLFSSIHYLHDHHHSDEIHEEHECKECIIIENSNNYVSDFQQVNFSNNIFNEFIALYLSTNEFNIIKSCSSRAPPISK